MPHYHLAFLWANDSISHIHYGGKKINTANFERDLFHSHFFHANHSEQKRQNEKVAWFTRCLPNCNTERCWLFLRGNSKKAESEIAIHRNYCIQKVSEDSTIPTEKTHRTTAKIVKKDKKKLVSDVLKYLKSTLERVRVSYNSFSTENTISKDTVRRILKKYGIKSRICAKKLKLKKNNKILRWKWCVKMVKQPAAYWLNVVFTEESRNRLNSDGTIRVFTKNLQDIKKKRTTG